MKIKYMKRFLIHFLCVAFFASSSTSGQEKPEKINLSMDVANNFIWRGLANNTTPVVQPTVTFLPESKFSFGIWASTPLSSDFFQPHEVDIFVDFQIAPFLTLNVTDYFVYSAGSEDYFNLKKDTTGHAFDVQLLFASENFPLKATVSTIFAGCDLNDEGKNNFSTYIELGYGKTGKYVDWEVLLAWYPSNQ
jgi:hypothetical protein